MSYAVIMALAQIKDAVLNLPEQERAEIARDLLRSLHVDAPGKPVESDARWLEVWRAEAAARDAELDSDETEGLSADDVLREARAAVAERKRARGR